MRTATRSLILTTMISIMMIGCIRAPSTSSLTVDGLVSEQPAYLVISGPSNHYAKVGDTLVYFAQVYRADHSPVRNGTVVTWTNGTCGHWRQPTTITTQGQTMNRYIIDQLNGTDSLIVSAGGSGTQASFLLSLHPVLMRTETPKPF